MQRTNLPARPIIGIPVGQGTNPRGAKLYTVHQLYLNAVYKSGGIPCPVPLHLDDELYRDIFQRLNGLLLAGGEDIDPHFYGDEPKDEIEKRVRETATMLELENYLLRKPHELSGGQRQRVAMGRALVRRPAVYLFDEPLSNLDPRSTGEVIDLLWEYNATTVVATQNLSLAPELGERAVLLSEDHRKIYDGDFDALLSDEKLLLEANLLHIHRHRHGPLVHRHFHPILPPLLKLLPPLIMHSEVGL